MTEEQIETFKKVANARLTGGPNDMLNRALIAALKTCDKPDFERVVCGYQNFGDLCKVSLTQAEIDAFQPFIDRKILNI